MEKKMICPHKGCTRCFGYMSTYSTDEDNSYYKVLPELPETLGPKEKKLWHFTCQKCKREIYVIAGFKN